MKLFIVLTLLMSSLSSFAQKDQGERTLKSVLNFSSCKMVITQKPVLFGKEKVHGRSNRLVFFAHESSSHLRRLKEGRAVRISSIDNRYIQLDDSSLSSICILAGKKCMRNIDDLTIAQIQNLSGENVKFICRKDKIKDF